MVATNFRLILMGAPGSGKGTIAKRLCDQLHLDYICSGDLLRNAIHMGNDDGKLAETYIEQGKLVPNELVTRLTFEQMTHKNRWLLDGFPRTLQQAKSLDNVEQIDQTVWLDVPEQEIINRIKGRRIHLASGRVYHLDYKPPLVPGRDDVTGDPLIQRPDDQEQAVRQRLLQYQEITKPVLDYYRDKQLLATFKGTESNVIYPQVLDYLRNKFVYQTSI